MHMVILLTHIVIASILVLTTSAVFAAAWQRRQTRAYRPMIGSFVLTIASGTVLLFVGLGGIGRICAAMSAVTLATIAARHYYLKRTAEITV